MKYLGCAYYPEYWGPDRVEIDAKLMKDASINLVRIGEFAWSKIEPEEGRFDFEWLHFAIDKLAEFDIKVLLCTPTATPPAWLTHKYTETVLVNSSGNRLVHGKRRHYCPSSKKYRELSEIVIKKLAEEFAGNENIIGWHLDNEPDYIETGFCYCDECQENFRIWLKEKYKTLQKLKEDWKTGFWSIDYTDFSQIYMTKNDGIYFPSQVLDTKRFASDILADFLYEQQKTIKSVISNTMVSTNHNSAVLADMDYYKVFDKMDIAFKDIYFDVFNMETNSMIMQQFRSFKQKPFWVIETGVGALDYNRPPKDGQFRAWMWSSFANGGEAHMVFRWRTCLSGQEQELQGILEHSGRCGHRYKAIKYAFNEMQEVSAKMGKLQLPQADVAMILDYDCKWAYDASVVGKSIQYEDFCSSLYERLYRLNICTDVISPCSDLASYKLVILPSMQLISQDFATRLKAYVKGGGVVYAQGQLGMRDEFNNYFGEEIAPRNLQDLFGVKILGGMYQASQVGTDEIWGVFKRDFTMGIEYDFTNRNDIKNSSEVMHGETSVWTGDIKALDANIIATITEDTYMNQPVIFENSYENGLAIYAGVLKFDTKTQDDLIAFALAKSGITIHEVLPKHIQRTRRDNLLFFINHTDEQIELNNIYGHTFILGNENNGKIILEPFGVCVINV